MGEPNTDMLGLSGHGRFHCPLGGSRGEKMGTNPSSALFSLIRTVTEYAYSMYKVIVDADPSIRRCAGNVGARRS